MAITATDKTMFPHSSPAASGTEPTAACTVAFGRYAITQNNLSCHVNIVFVMHSKTPQDLKSSAVRIINTAIIPASNV